MANIFDINLSNSIDKDTLYNLFKSKKSDVNIELFAKMLTFNTNIDFFNFYSEVDLNPLLDNINKIKLELTSLTSNRSIEEKRHESYFSSLSKIIVSLILINKLNKIKNETLTQVQKYSRSFFLKNNVSQKLRLEIKEHISDLLSKSDSHRSQKKGDKNNDNSGDNNNAIFTPKFEEIEPAKRFVSSSSSSIFKVNEKEAQKKLNKNHRKSFYGSCRNLRVSSKKKHRKSNFSKRQYDSENLEVLITDMNNLNFSFGETPKKNNKKKASKFMKKTKSVILDEPIKLGSAERLSYNENKPSSSRQVYTDMYFKLLEIIKESYQKGLINAEEKLSLKNLIISKEAFIFDMYKKYYLNAYIKGKNKKQEILDEMKKFVLQNNL